jgi:hypothetical protein
MFPFSFEWTYETTRLVFMGGLWYALGILGAGMTYCIIKAVKDSSGGNGDGHTHH